MYLLLIYSIIVLIGLSWVGVLTMPKNDDSLKQIIPCPNPKCKQKLRVPVNRGKLKITCPKCRESFVWDSGSVILNGSTGIRKTTKSLLIVLMVLIAFIYMVYNYSQNVNKREVQENYQKGYGLLNSQKYSEAITAFTKVIEVDRRHKEAYNGRGVAYAHLGNKQKAYENYVVAAELGDPIAQKNLQQMVEQEKERRDWEKKFFTTEERGLRHICRNIDSPFIREAVGCYTLPEERVRDVVREETKRGLSKDILRYPFE